MKILKCRISDLLSVIDDEPKGTSKYLVRIKSSDYLSPTTSLKQALYETAYWREMNKQTYITKISVWPHHKFKKEVWMYKGHLLASVMTGTVYASVKDVVALCKYLNGNKIRDLSKQQWIESVHELAILVSITPNIPGLLPRTIMKLAKHILSLENSH
jgi:hypothetical protein